jgi:hypothetical protein
LNSVSRDDARERLRPPGSALIGRAASLVGSGARAAAVVPARWGPVPRVLSRRSARLGCDHRIPLSRSPHDGTRGHRGLDAGNRAAHAVFTGHGA